MPDIWDLLDRLDAAAEDSAAYHHDLCQQYPGQPCSCRAGDLFRDAAEFVRGVVVQDAIERATTRAA